MRLRTAALLKIAAELKTMVHVISIQQPEMFVPFSPNNYIVLSTIVTLQAPVFKHPVFAFVSCNDLVRV